MLLRMTFSKLMMLLTCLVGVAPGTGLGGDREQVDELPGLWTESLCGSEPNQSPPSGQPPLPESREPSKESKLVEQLLLSSTDLFTLLLDTDIGSVEMINGAEISIGEELLFGVGGGSGRGSSMSRNLSFVT